MTEKTLREVTVTFTGSCKGNPGPGSWKALLWDPATRKQDTARGDVPNTTNIRMELTAALEGIHRVKAGASLTMVGSNYVVQGMTEWITKWQANGWRKGGGGRVEHRELWEALIGAVKKHRTVMWRKA
ncbi:RNase H family protein [Methylorubrum extorquens]